MKDGETDGVRELVREKPLHEHLFGAPRSNLLIYINSHGKLVYTFTLVHMTLPKKKKSCHHMIDSGRGISLKGGVFKGTKTFQNTIIHFVGALWMLRSEGFYFLYHISFC